MISSQIYCQCPFQDNHLMKRWTLLKKKKKAQCSNSSSSINLQKQAMRATFRLASGNVTLGLQGQFDARGPTAGSACCLNVIGKWKWYFIAGFATVLHLIEPVAFCFHTLVKWLFIKWLSTWRPIVCGCVCGCVCVCGCMCGCGCVRVCGCVLK